MRALLGVTTLEEEVAAARAVPHLGEGARVKVTLPGIVSQGPHFSQYGSGKLTSLKELDSIWPSQLVVMI